MCSLLPGFLPDIGQGCMQDHDLGKFPIYVKISEAGKRIRGINERIKYLTTIYLTCCFNAQ
jgi:hypothetical protein